MREYIQPPMVLPSEIQFRESLESLGKLGRFETAPLQEIPVSEEVREKIRKAMKDAIRSEKTNEGYVLEEHGRKIALGFQNIVAHGHLLGERSNLFQGDEEKVMADDSNHILALYNEIHLPNEKPGLFLNMRLTHVFAERMGVKLRLAGMQNIFPRVLGAMGLLRNSGTILLSGYQSRLIASHKLCEALGVHRNLRAYLRPMWASKGPLDREQYLQLGEERRRRIVQEYLDGVWEKLTHPQILCEFAGVLAKQHDGKLLPWSTIRRDLLSTRASQKAYEKAMGGSPSPWAIDEEAYRTLHPDFIWTPIYDRIVALLAAHDIDLGKLQEEVQIEMDSWNKEDDIDG